MRCFIQPTSHYFQTKQGSKLSFHMQNCQTIYFQNDNMPQFEEKTLSCQPKRAFSLGSIYMARSAAPKSSVCFSIQLLQHAALQL